MIATIIRDVRGKTYSYNEYPSLHNFLQNVNEGVPHLLRMLLDDLIIKRSKENLKILQKKVTTIGHLILSAMRPRSFISSIQLSVGVYLHRKCELSTLVDVLSRLDLCSTYHNVTMLASFALMYEKPTVNIGAFIQRVQNNADINGDTEDGHNTLHIMGDI